MAACRGKAGEGAGQSAGRGARLAVALSAMLLVVLLTGSLAGCSTLGYYAQSIHGHASLLQAARPIDDWLADPATPAGLKERLERVRAIRAYASRELGLPDNASYRSYAQLGRPFVLWNVTAAPELGLRLMQWCFPVAGCVGYRGYYDRASATAYAAELAAAGWDVQVGGVRAYSTLGWTPDPVLSTFIDLPEVEVARLIFHELAHQLLYVAGDSTFNESFATAFEEEGVRRWLQARADPAGNAAWERYRARRAAWLGLLNTARTRLAAAYAGTPEPAAARAAKAAILAGLRADYQVRQRDPASPLYRYAGYDRFFDQGLNNASLAGVATYTHWLPAFAKLLQESGNDLARFAAAAREIAGLDAAARGQRLTALLAEARDGGVAMVPP